MHKTLLIFLLFLSLKDTKCFAQKIKLQKLSTTINTNTDEYSPTISTDENTLFFTRLIKDAALQNEDLYYSTKDSTGSWGIAVPISELNSDENEGGQTISANNRFIIFTSCNKSNSYGSCDLFYSLKVNGKWLPARNLGSTINTKDWEAQPALSADGTELYFVSNRDGGKGGMDIWHSHLEGIDTNGNMKWSIPINLNINTTKDEMSPFIHSDNKTLYFSSNSHGTNTQFDIYVSRKENIEFSSPQNIEYPINSKANEIGFSVNTAGNIAYFSSDREGVKNLYRCILDTNKNPQKVQILYGKILAVQNKKPIFAVLSLHAVNEGTNYQTLSDSENGDYLLCLTEGKKWRLSVQAQGYFFHSEDIDLREQRLTEQHKNISLSPIKKGAKINLQNIFFDTDKATLKQESIMELEQIKLLLLSNPSLKIEIGGHTDNQGTMYYNQELSEARAQAVYNWLINEGIAKEKLLVKGYGKTVPIATNNTVDGRTQNRRTALKVIEY